MIEEKRKRLRNSKLKNLTGLETEELKKIRAMRLELAEMKQNIWKHYRDEGRNVKPAGNEGRKMAGKKGKSTLMEIQERKKREEQDWKMELEQRWAMIEDCIKFVEDEEKGLSTSGMEDMEKLEKTWAQEETKKVAKIIITETKEEGLWKFWKGLDGQLKKNIREDVEVDKIEPKLLPLILST